MIGFRWCLICLTGLMAVAAAQASTVDLVEGRDPAELPRYPHAWIVDYAVDGEVLPRDFVTSRVDRIRRDLYLEGARRIEATLERVTYQLPEGTPPQDVAAHYAQLLGDAVVFRCSGRDCGRSNDWANQIFGRAMLYGPDANQAYLAAEIGDQLLMLYVIERGNKRVYAHLELLSPQGRRGAAVADGGAQPEAAGRRAFRWRELEGVVPDADGVLGPTALERLQTLAAAMADAGGLDPRAELYLVCHLYGVGPVVELRARSVRCADSAAAQLADSLGRGVEAFGAGPLLPRGEAPRNRLELIIAGPASAE
ncbi:MAG: DUF4892 domain-containing protein [Pseudomonadales bacterium]